MDWYTNISVTHCFRDFSRVEKKISLENKEWELRGNVSEVGARKQDLIPFIILIPCPTSGHKKFTWLFYLVYQLNLSLFLFIPFPIAFIYSLLEVIPLGIVFYFHPFFAESQLFRFFGKKKKVSVNQQQNTIILYLIGIRNSIHYRIANC